MNYSTMFRQICREEPVKNVTSYLSIPECSKSIETVRYKSRYSDWLRAIELNEVPVKDPKFNETMKMELNQYGSNEAM